MLGYEDNPEANDNIFTDGGFIRTGDIGYIDDDGLSSTAQKNSLTPAKLEDVLNLHPAVSDCCCVVRSKNKMGEEIPKAFVVLKHPDSPGRPTAQEIMDYMAEHVAFFKKVREDRWARRKKGIDWQ
ncbi:hypothetical protein PsorP6_006924 [Peronosclerospora sorghi]|uniref:Uncharacterized protein n=1 Tax=Peronosclerospora sorghi TaxID=230839 RepID=A0ACC0WD10_9STRA|nr:hypothetical protein PsorP6_006924 [Peronosclerospora sorghi]